MAIDESRRQFLTALLLTALGVIAGCGTPDLTRYTEEEPPQPAHEVQVASPHASSQLISGWYSVEGNSWRWTAGKFAVVLSPPVGSAIKGATLTLHFTLPAVVISRLHSLTLSASIRGARLSPETYSKAGQAIYSRDVPPGLLSGNTVRVDFELNRVMVPGNGDTRELGVIADRVGLEVK